MGSLLFVMSFSVRCLLSVVCSVLVADWLLMSVVCWLLRVVRCSLFVACCVLWVVCCLLLAVCCLRPGVCWLVG